MKSQTGLIFGLVMVGIFLGLAVWIVRSVPSETEIQAAVQVLPSLPAGDLSDASFTELGQRQVHGTLPVPALSPESPRSDPFN
jgi:hypothetical protein